MDETNPEIPRNPEIPGFKKKLKLKKIFLVLADHPIYKVHI
jgi:hypothetical protein